MALPGTRAKMTSIPLHTNLADDSTLANGPPSPVQIRDALNTITQNLVDKPTLANESPSTRAEMNCIPLPKTWQMTLHWLMDIPSNREEMICITLHKTWQMTLLWPMDPPFPMGTREEKPWIPLHKTWQTNLLWPMDPTGTKAVMTYIPPHKNWQMTLLWPMSPLLIPEQRCLEYCSTQNLADYPTLASGPHPPWVPEKRSLGYHYTKLPDKPTLARWFASHYTIYLSKDYLHTTTQKLADEPTLANEPPKNRSRDALHTSTPNLAD